jgi:PAS domain S-box-containing protein
MSEIRAPFIKAVLITSAISLIVILIASFLFRRVTNPIVETIRNSEKKYRSLVEEINEWVWATDEHGVLTYSSPQIESMLGVGFGEAVGRRLDEVFHPNQETMPSQKQNMNAIFRNRTVSEYEVDVLDSEGMPVCLLFSAHPIYEEEELIGYQGIAFDITERKEAERLRLEYQETLEKQVQVRTEELHEINEELKRFTYIVSHDLRSPLVSIVGFASEIRQDIGSLQTPKTFEVLSETDQQIVDHVIPESLDYIEAATSKMDGLIKNILQLSRIGQRELQFEPVSCQQVVKRNLKALGYQLESAKVTLSELPEIESDATAIEQIFGNLLGNAVKFCDPKRDLEIAIWAEQENDTVSFFIRDNGLGIAEKDIPFIFDLFKRVGDQTTQGEGMGLAYVQTLVRKLGGKIACTSSLGLGTTFKVVLPISSKALN